VHQTSELEVGMTIEHNRFGRGVITEIDAQNPSGPRIIVNFNNIDFKTLLLKFAKFTIIQ
jgi:DNA helicase-2/ATP-dependent DNA helicase PcrA